MTSQILSDPIFDLNLKAKSGQEGRAFLRANAWSFSNLQNLLPLLNSRFEKQYQSEDDKKRADVVKIALDKANESKSQLIFCNYPMPTGFSIYIQMRVSKLFCCLLYPIESLEKLLNIETSVIFENSSVQIIQDGSHFSIERGLEKWLTRMCGDVVIPDYRIDKYFGTKPERAD